MTVSGNQTTAYCIRAALKYSLFRVHLRITASLCSLRLNKLSFGVGMLMINAKLVPSRATPRENPNTYDDIILQIP